VPGKHWSQTVDPTAWNVPAAQWTQELFSFARTKPPAQSPELFAEGDRHDAEPATEMVPFSQRVQFVEPMSGAEKFAAQRVHASAPEKGFANPRGQLKQSPLTPADPGEQRVHSDAPLCDVDPLGHVEQLVAPAAAAYVDGEHCMHSAPAELELPFAHKTQEVRD
jgi:hypothetical protein